MNSLSIGSPVSTSSDGMNVSQSASSTPRRSSLRTACATAICIPPGRLPCRPYRLVGRRFPSVTHAFRTPDERFDGLPGFPFEPHYRELDGLRLAHLDEGEGRPVVFFHGEPTWSYLWRKVIPPVRDAGFRCIAPDYAGFGRSDKPTDLGWYSYDRHTETVKPLLEELDLRDAVAVVHDWGGPIGLRCAVEMPERFSAMVVMDTGLFTGEQPMSEPWKVFRDFVERTEDLPISMLVRERRAPAGWRTRSPPPTTRRSRRRRRRPAPGRSR